MRTFEFSDASSHKFWNIEVVGTYYQVKFGKIGSNGQTQRKTLATAGAAQAEADKLIKEKLKKGYIETTPKAAAGEEDAFIAALRANPDDLAGWCAYADFLVEKGDPRGEFMQTQIALEDESRPKKDRDTLKKKEKALLKAHAVEWVGVWADHENTKAPSDEWRPPNDAWRPYTFTRGVLSGVEVGVLNVELARLIVKAPQLGFVRELVVHDIDYEEGDFEEGPDVDDATEYPGQDVLLRWPQLKYVRTFRFGGGDPQFGDYDYAGYRSHTPGDRIADFVKRMPDIEVLHIMAHFREEARKLVALPMPKLRELVLYHGWEYPLDKLAKNESLTNLRELNCHPHALEEDDPYIRLPHLRALCKSPHLTALTHLRLHMGDFGDAGIREVIKTGMLKRLKVLDFRHGLVTDDGAKELAACPDLKNLEFLDLSWNRLTDAGVNALKATGVNALLTRQQSPTADRWETFHHGDIE